MKRCHSHLSASPPLQDWVQLQYKPRYSFGPIWYCGIGIVHGFANQGTEGLCHLIQKILMGRELGTMMVSILSQFQLMFGFGYALLELPDPMPTRSQKKLVYSKQVPSWPQLVSISSQLTSPHQWIYVDPATMGPINSEREQRRHHGKIHLWV